MISAGGLTLALLILGPIAWSKYASWRFEKARASREGGGGERGGGVGSKQAFVSVPSPLLLPSNLLLSIVLLALVYLHLSVLFNPRKVLERSDIFLITDTKVHSPLVYIRSRVASMSFQELGWRQDWGEEGIEKVLRKLGSFEGRRLHLMIGTRPFIGCTFCSTSTDYLLFSLIDYITQYAIDLLLFGILTLRCNSLDIFDEIVFSTIQMISGISIRPREGREQPSSSLLLRPDGHRYRVVLMYMIGAFVLAQASIYFGMLSLSFGQGRGDHFYANFQLAYHSLSLLFALVIYFGQRRSRVPAIVEIAHLIKQSRQSTDQTLLRVQAMHLTNQTIWTDQGLRNIVTKWHEEEGKAAQSVLSEEAIHDLETRAAKAGVDVGTVRREAQTIARELWESTQQTAEFWERSKPRSTPPNPAKDPDSARAP